MNKLLILIAAAIAAAAVLLIAAYVIKFPPAVEFVEPLTETIQGLQEGGLPDIQTLVTGASVAGTATSVVGLYGQYKDKISAQASALKTAVTNNEITAELSDLKSVKSDLETKLTDATQTKDQALQELESVKSQFSSLEEEKQKMQNTIDTLHEALKRNKLSENESIIKKIIQ